MELKGSVTDAHDEHVLVVSTWVLACIVAGLEALLLYESKTLNKEQNDKLEELITLLRDGLAEGVTERKENSA